MDVAVLVVVLVLAIASVAALTAAVIVGSAIIAWACIGLSALGLLVLLIDVRRVYRRRETGSGIEPAQPTEHNHTAGDDLFGEHEVERDLVREERVLSPDMLGSAIPYEEVAEDLRNASQSPARHHGHRSVQHLRTLP
jgi:hypothetical protein